MDERHERVAQESTDAEVDDIASLMERASERLLVLVRFVAGTHTARLPSIDIVCTVLSCCLCTTYLRNSPVLLVNHTAVTFLLWSLATQL